MLQAAGVDLNLLICSDQRGCGLARRWEKSEFLIVCTAGNNITCTDNCKHCKFNTRHDWHWHMHD